MSKARFMFVIQHIRLDDINSRSERREILESFVANCQFAYTPYQKATIEEQLEEFWDNVALDNLFMANAIDTD